ncbi:MAG: glycosyltransferase [Lentisphaeria bacterium]|nr:glycosyltransferase [Lentisphaeria bacterium]
MPFTMTITVITICRNSAQTLQRTIDSILLQQLKPQQYLLVDGASTDNTLNILQQNLPLLQSAGISAKILPQAPLQADEAGIPVAWNQGLQQADGDIIALLNSDDWYEPQTLAKILQAFTENPETEAVVCPVRLLHPAGGEKLLLPRCLYLLPLLMPLPHPGCFFRRSLYDRIGHYDTHYRIAADYDFIWRCRQAETLWRTLAEPLVNMEAGGLANSSRKKARLETLTIARNYIPWCPLPYLAYLLRQLTGR